MRIFGAGKLRKVEIKVVATAPVQTIPAGEFIVIDMQRVSDMLIARRSMTQYGA